MKDIATRARVKVCADGRGVVSHAGVGMLRELADSTGLSAHVTAALADTYRGPWTHAPGDVFSDLAVADGADCIDGVGQACGDREHVFGPAASTTTTWRLLDARVDAEHLPGIRTARAAARAAAWAAGAAPSAGEWLHIDIDATITIDHSNNKEQDVHACGGPVGAVNERRRIITSYIGRRARTSIPRRACRGVKADCQGLNARLTCGCRRRN